MAAYKFDARPHYLYIIVLEKDNPFDIFVKIGITHNIESRLRQLGKLGYELKVIDIQRYENRTLAFDREQEYKAEYSIFLEPANFKFGGYTECYSSEILCYIPNA